MAPSGLCHLRLVRRLVPTPSDQVDLVEAYAPPEPPVDRPFVRCNMISSIDGAIAVEGRSGMLGGPADRRVFATLRSLADVILVGAGTVRAEGYGPARFGDELRAARVGRGLHHVLGEGGPGLNAELVQAELLDELCLTMAPRMVGGAGPRVLAGEELAPPVDLELVQLLEEDGFLFYRLRLPRRG